VEELGNNASNSILHKTRLTKKQNKQQQKNAQSPTHMHMAQEGVA
jgi:hypothetical protein